MALEIFQLQPGTSMTRAEDRCRDDVSLQALEQIDSICLAFELKWKSGEREDLAGTLRGAEPDIPRRALLRELLRIDMVYRHKCHQKLDLAYYQEQLAEHADLIAEVYEEFHQGSSVPATLTDSTVPHPGPIDSLKYKPSAKSGDHLDTGNTPQETPETVVSRYRIVRSHANGGLGEVFVALDSELNRDVALKEIQPQFAKNDDSQMRFRREAEITGNLEHPGIVPVYGLGHHSDGRPYYAMRFIRGESLKEAIEQHHARYPSSVSTMTEGAAGIDLRKLVGRFIDVCNAMEYAHS